MFNKVKLWFFVIFAICSVTFVDNKKRVSILYGEAKMRDLVTYSDTAVSLCCNYS